MRKPQLRDQNVLIPSIGRSMCRASHFWSHDLVDLMIWSPQLGDQNDAKATMAGSECFDPQHWGIKITRYTNLRDKFDFWSQTQWNLFGNQYLWIASSPRFLKYTYCIYAIRISIMWELVWNLTARHSCERNTNFEYSHQNTHAEKHLNTRSQFSNRHDPREERLATSRPPTHTHTRPHSPTQLTSISCDRTSRKTWWEM
jgi:hypothetical protein